MKTDRLIRILKISAKPEFRSGPFRTPAEAGNRIRTATEAREKTYRS